MEKSDYNKYWKLEMMAESAEAVFKEKEKIVVDIPSPQKRDSMPEWPEWLVKVMRKENGYDPKLIMARNLFMSDLDKVQACLSMPFKQVKNSDFLTEEETRIIDEQYTSKYRMEGVKVLLVDPQSREHVVDLRKRNMNGCWKYVFNNGWKEVVAKNTFNIGDVTEIWSFRYGRGELGFALSPLTRSGQSSSRPSSSHHHTIA